MINPGLPQPLVAQEGRRAHPANKGFSHQHWLSVLAWVRLSSTELLVIEGVEDFDRIGHGEAHLTQVKRKAEDLRLSTKEAAVTVGNYLIAAAKNGDYVLYFSYVTTAAAGIEPNTKLKTNTRAIIVWKACAEADLITGDLLDDLEHLPEILARAIKRRKSSTEKKADVARSHADQKPEGNDKEDDKETTNEQQALRYLEDHLFEITSDHFLDSLIRRIFWDVSSPDTESIKDLVCQELMQIADKLEVRPRTLKECRFRLLDRVMSAAGGQNDGRLTRAELDAEIQVFLEELHNHPGPFREFEGTAA